MNRTALSVIGLAVGAVLIIGLFNIYKPAVSHVAHDVFSKVHVNHLGLKEHKWGSLYYTDDHHGNIEFTRGKLNSSNGEVFAVSNVPAIRNAKSLKFDNVDTTGARNVRWMFANDSHLQSVDLGDNFDTHNVIAQNDEVNSIQSGNWGFSSMFQGDPNLEHINLGSKFKLTSPVNKWKLENMFEGDSKLQQPTGNVPQEVQDAYNKRMQSWYPAPPN